MMRPYLGRRVLEIGCGTGNITGLLSCGGGCRREVLGVDVHPGYLARAREKNRGIPGVRFKRVDLDRGLKPLRTFRPDTILCVNVMEHIREDVPLFVECFRLLPPGGHLLLFVPAMQSLFGSMDVTYGHFRRYSRRELESKMRIAGFRAASCRYLNLLGILGWWWNGKVLRRPIVPKGPMMLYDRIVAVTRHFERFLPRPIGLSLFCAGRKP
jgi:SAM-dependent methyltransferase